MGKYIEQYAHDLFWYLILGRTRVKFDVRQRESISWPVARIDAAIIGESHFVVFNIFNIILTEIIACVKVKTKKIHWSGPVNRFESIAFTIADVHYYLQTKIFDWEEGKDTLFGINNLAQVKGKDKHCIVLREQFPPKVEGDRSAETIVVIELEPVEGVEGKVEAVNVNTIHTYPDNNQGKIVRTLSRLEKKLFVAPSSKH